MTKINREQLRQIIKEAADEFTGDEMLYAMTGDGGDEPMVQGTFEIRPEPLGGDIIEENQGVILTLSGPDGISTTHLSREDLNRGTFVIDINDIIAMNIPVGRPLPK